MLLAPFALVVKSLLALEWEGLVSFLDCWTASVCADPSSILFQVNLVHEFLAHVSKVLYTTKNSCTAANLYGYQVWQILCLYKCKLCHAFCLTWLDMGSVSISAWGLHCCIGYPILLHCCMGYARLLRGCKGYLFLLHCCIACATSSALFCMSYSVLSPSTVLPGS